MFVDELQEKLYTLDCIQEGSHPRVTVDLASRLVIVSKIMVRSYPMSMGESPSTEYVAEVVKNLVSRRFPQFEVILEFIDPNNVKYVI